MEFSCANGDLLIFQQMQTGLLNIKLFCKKSFRTEVLSLAHKNPLSGHLGVTKIYYIRLNHLFWPCTNKDVSEVCRSCHICQMVGKPNQKIQRASLQPISALEEPFRRVLIDCVGPLLKSNSSNE